MKKRRKKPDETLLKLALATAGLSLLEKLIEVIIRLLEIIGGK